MKKRKILLGLALAASVFGLAACNGTDGGNTQAPSTQSGNVATYTVKFFSDEAGTQELSSTTVREGETVTEPTTTPTAPAGYKFDCWTSNGITQYNFNDEVFTDLNLKPKFAPQGKYDELASSANKIIASDFDDVTTLPVATEFNATEARFAKTAEEGVEINSLGEVYLDYSNFITDFGADKKDGVVTVYFEVNFQGVQGEAFAQIVGKSETKTEKNDEVFALRTSSSKFAYRFDALSDNPLKKNNTQVAATTGQTYKFLIEVDMVDHVLSVTLNDDLLLDKEPTTISQVRGLKFTCKANSGSKKTLDNIAATFETKQKSPLAIAKETAIAELNAKTLSTDLVIKAAEQDAIAEGIVNINKSATEAEVTAAKNAVIEYLEATKYVLTVKAYKAANTAASTFDYVQVLKSTETVNKNDFAFSMCSAASAVYTDGDLTQAYTEGVLTSNTTLYAQVTELTSVKVTPEDFTRNQAANGQVAKCFEITDSGAISFDQFSSGDQEHNFKFAADGDKTKNNIAIKLVAGSYTVKVKAKSGSSGNNADFAVATTTAANLTFDNDGVTEKTTSVTLSADGYVYFYRPNKNDATNGGKTINVVSIEIVKA